MLVNTTEIVGLIAQLLGYTTPDRGKSTLSHVVESNAHPRYKQQLLEASEKDTVRTILFGHGWPNAPHRTLRTRFVKQWLGNESRTQESRTDELVIGKTWIGGREIPIQRFSAAPPSAHVAGDIDSMALLAGQAVGHHAKKPCIKSKYCCNSCSFANL